MISIDKRTPRPPPEPANLLSEYAQEAKADSLDFDNIELSDVIDAPAIQEMMNDYFDLTGIGIGIIDLKGNILVGTGWQDICVKFHRAVPESYKLCYECDTALSSGVPPGTFKTYRCKNNLWDMATPIMLGERHIGNIFLGQFLYDDEEPDYDLFRAQAKRFGYDETAYIAALDKVSRFSRHTVQTAMSYYAKLAQTISKSNFNNVILKQALAERKLAEELLRANKDKLQEQNEELQANDEELRSQNDHLLATEEMLRVQINDYESSRKLLRESEDKHRKLSNEQQTILNTSSIGIIFVKNRKVVWANPAHCAMFGYELGATKDLDTAVYYIDEESYKYVGEKAYSTIASGDIYSEDVIMKKKDGSLIWCNLVGQAVNHKNMEEGSIWSILDISERKRAEEERKQLEHQFHQAQKLESLGVLAGGIAHDFNNILTVILGHCYIAKSDYIPETEYKEVFLKIETAGNRAADLCRQMLTYAGKSPMAQTPVNLWLLVDEVIKILQAAIKKNVTIELDLKHDILEINGDTAQIQQIIMNLIINAADAIGEANGTIRVVLTKAAFEADYLAKDMFGTFIKPGIYACLEVADTGSGMDEATMKRIFEPFFTTKCTGRGLGMSAIQGIIKSHEGNLQLTSTPGVGTTFKVFFPIPNASANTETIATTVSLTKKASGTILLVEDEETLRVMGKELLDSMGFTAMTASNGSEALEIYSVHGSEIDLILLDLIMPVMGGIKAYHELRRINPTVPIIICSGYGVESVEEVIEKDPFAGFVHKPYKPSELRDVAVKMIG